jgi:diguanylate cyclase (GGDEF)-like protein/PAS domain S-box-containing protein
MTKRQSMFPLLRHFSITSLIAVIATTLLLGTLHNQVERTQLLDLGESNHIALTQAFANSLLPSFRELSVATQALDTPSLSAHPLQSEMRAGVVDIMKNTRVVKVKLYDLNGRTIFSTDPTQIGKDYKDNAGFIAAARGKPESELTHRKRFSAFDKEIVDRDVLSSYVALRTGVNAPVEGVIEVYSDVTDWVLRIDQQSRLLTIATVLSLCLLYAVLYFIVRRADRLLRTQYEALRHSEGELRIAANVFESQVSMVVTDAHSTIMRVNEAFTKTSGYGAEELVGQTPRLLKSERHEPSFYQAMWHSIEQTGGWQGEVWDRRKNGEEYPKWLTISAVRDESGKITHYVGTHLDITERKKADELIESLAFYDPLTGLPNRTLLRERIQHALNLYVRSNRHGALMFIDLDHFKSVNDTLGHDAGDALLKQVAERLLGSVRQCDTVARWGGDEFIIMLENLDTDAALAKDQLVEVGNKLLAEFNKPFPLGDRLSQHTASIGATLFGDHPCTMDDLLKQADDAMYQAKAEGRNAVIFFGEG